MDDKDLPDIKPEDIKIDISAVDALKPSELVVVKQRWVSDSRTNEQLVLLLEQCPTKVARIEANMVNEKDPDSIKSLTDKIARLKEEYAVVIKEIELRKAKVK